MKKQYELIQDGIAIDYFTKNNTGLDKAYQQAEQVILDEANDYCEDFMDSLEIHCVTYNACGVVVECELVHKFDLTEANVGN